MIYRIYQIEKTDNEDYSTFVVLGQLRKAQEHANVDSNLFSLVYQGCVDCASSIEILRSFNSTPPQDYNGRPLCVGDVVEIVGNNNSVYYFINLFGYTKVSFNANKAKTARFLNGNIPVSSERDFSFTVKMKLFLSANDVDRLVGIILENATWYYRAECVKSCSDEYIEKQLTLGGTIRFFVNGKHYDLSIQKLLIGFRLWIEREPDYTVIHNGSIDIRSIGQRDANHILQYALFGNVRFQ